MKPFSTLTVRGQARRLRELAENALTHYSESCMEAKSRGVY
jgi:hypothetical protein